MNPRAVSDAMAPRWRKQPGRLEVWYATFSDPVSAIGCWVHHEVVSPLDGAPYAHGWIALFEPGAAPVLERFGPTTIPEGANSWPSSDVSAFEPPTFRGKAGRLVWDLLWDDTGAAPLYTFPLWAWKRELLPAAQIVPVPDASFSGTIECGGTVHRLSAQCRGNVAHIYGHGSAERWGWFHGALGGGDVLEIVTATSRRRGLDRLPPLALVQLRTAGRDWPRRPLLAAALFRSKLGNDSFEVRGTLGRFRLAVEVKLPESRTVALKYVDPDGSTATCTNSEVADAEVLFEHLGTRWRIVGNWTLRGTAHAEVGRRP